jgi:hypothetical protein
MNESFVSIRTILDQISDVYDSNLWNEMTAIEHIARAMSYIKAPKQLEPAVALVKVENHKACLPNGIVYLEMIGYKANHTITEYDLTDIKEAVGHSNDNYYAGFFYSDYYQKHFRPLRLASSPFAVASTCDDCEPHNNTNEYIILPNGTIQTSFKEGYVCIA